MTHRDFVYWLQGFFEIAKPETMTAEQVELVQKHLALCLENRTGTSIPSLSIPQFSQCAQTAQANGLTQSYC